MVVDTREMLSRETPVPEDLDLTWLRSPSDWGIAARPGKRGLTLDEVNIGAYGEPPAVPHGMTMLPRGAAVREGVPRVGYTRWTATTSGRKTRRSSMRRPSSVSGRRQRISRGTRWSPSPTTSNER